MEIHAIPLPEGTRWTWASGYRSPYFWGSPPWDSCLPSSRLATRCEGFAMIWITAIVTLFLFGYLMVALLRPEKF